MAAAKNPSNKNKNTKAKTPVKANSKTDVSPEIDKIAAVFLGVFSVMLFLSLFGVNALLLDFLSDFIKGLVGIGFFLVPFVFAYGAVVFGFFKKEKRFISQIISVMFLPVAAGMWGHIIANGGNTYFNPDYFSVYSDGISYNSGGIISGTLSDCFTFLISVYGSIICLALITVLSLLYIFRFSLRGLIGYLGIRHEQNKTARDMEKSRKAEIKDSESSRIPDPVFSSTGRNPGDINDYNIPLGNNKTRPDAPIGVFSMDPKDTPLQSKNSRSYDIPLDSGKKTYDPADTIKTPVTQSRSSSVPDLSIPKISTQDYDLASSDPDSGTDDIFEPGEIIYDFTEGDEDIIIGEIPLPSDDPKTTDLIQDKAVDSKMSQGLKPGQAEKERQALNRERSKPPEYIKPPIELLTEDTSVPNGASDDEIKSNAKRLLETLSSFNIDAKITNIIRGPSITRYEVQLRQGIRFSRLTALSEDIALSLAAQAVRIAAIPDKVSIGIEVPNKNVNTVYIRDCLASKEFSGNPSKVTFSLGKDITGRSIVWDIAKLPHMLVAGTTGSGKSVCINSLIISILYKASPDEVKLIMIDPKIIELGIYNGIPHLMIPVVTDPKKAAGALQWAVYEMMRRYKLLAELNVRSLFEYNAEVEKRASLPHSEDDPVYEKLPQIIIVIDELADLMLSSPREVEEAICRIAQMARAAGMHLIIATQRPSADVITGLMKANIPSRIAFTVSSALESRIILDTQGAEKLVGRGDMLFSPIGATKPMRIQGCFITAGEIEAVVKHVQRYGSANYNTDIIDHIEKASENVGKKSNGNSAANQQDSSSQSEEDYEDPLLNDAIDIVMENSQASASMLQRKLRLGYTRAARLIDIMEARGIIGSFEGSKPRQILISKDYWLEMKSRRSE